MRGGCRVPPGSRPGSGFVVAQPAWVTVVAALEPPLPDGADGRLTQLGTGPVMIPPAPTEPLRGLPVNASIIVSPAGMLPLILTETERCPCLFTREPTCTAGCGAG
jgi:hypothetical protein